MLSSKRWLLWKEIPNKDESKKPRKVPFYTNGTPRNGILETEDDLKNLSSFDAAIRALSTGKYTGLGFAFGQDGDTGNYFQGIDIDKISEHPELVPIVEDLPGYVEKSPNGNGYHALGYGKKFDALGSNDSGIEAYSFGRFFTVTGEVVSGFDLKDLSIIIDKKLKPIHSITNSQHSHEFIDYEKVSIEDVRMIRSALNCFTADDRDRWIRYGHALCRLGNVGRSLWMEWSQQSDKHDPLGDAKTWESFRGDKTGYPSIFKDAYAFGWDGNKKHTTVEKGVDTTVVTVGEWINADSMADNAKAPMFMINDILETKSHGIIGGSSQSFKSFCVLKMAHSICTGKDFFGNVVFGNGKVLYICGEGMGALERRIKAIKIVDGEFNDCFFVLSKPLFIDNIAEIMWLKEQIDSINPVFLILDTFSSLATSTKENANDEVASTLAKVKMACSDTDCSSIIVHHYGKDAGKGIRGASSFGANIDFELSMVRNTDTMDTTLSCIKMKDSEPFKPIDITAHVVDLGMPRQDGKPTTSLILRNGNGSSGLTDRQEKALEIIRRLIFDDGIECDGHYGVNDTQVKRAFNVEFKDEMANPYKAFSEIIPALKKKGKIEEKDSFLWIK